MNSNKGFILKESVMSATEMMSDKEFRRTITALFNYAARDEKPVFGEDDRLSKMIFIMEKPAIDNNNRKWAIRSRNNNTLSDDFGF